jgi:site-specific DNA-cytosine methylase
LKLNEVKQIGNIVNTGNWDNPQRGRIYSADGICPALNTVGGGGLEPKIIEDFYKNREPRVYDETAPTIRAEREGLKVIVASRGRNPDNPSDQTAGSPTEQRLEPNSQGICNTLTSVQKDNLVLEPNELQFIGGLGNKDRVGDGKELSRNFPQGERVYSSQGIGCSQTAQGGGTGSYTGLYLHNYRIRKLTPKECWRLMGFTDEDFHKAEKVNSNTQLYKQAGNSIVVEVLEGIFKQMF